MRVRLILFFSIILTGCSVEENPREEVNNPLDLSFGGEEKGDFGNVVYNERTVVLNEQLKQNLLEVSSDYLVFNSSESFDMIKKGDVLFSNVSKNGFEGLSRKIISIEKQDDNIRFITEKTDISEVYEKAEISQDFEFDYKGIVNLVEEQESVTDKQQLRNRLVFNTKDDKTTLSLEIDFDGNFATEKDQIRITGFVEHINKISPHIDFRYNKLFPLTSFFHLNGSTEITNGLELTYGGKKEEDLVPDDFINILGSENSLTKKIDLFKIPMTGVSPTNLVIKPNLVFFIRLNVELSGKISIELKKSYQYDYAANLNMNNSGGIWNHEFRNISKSPYQFNASLTGEINAELTPIGVATLIEFPQLKLVNNNRPYIGFFIHPYSVDLNAKAELNIGSDGNCFKYDLTAQAKFKASLEADLEGLFGRWKAKVDRTIFDEAYNDLREINSYEKCFESSTLTVSTKSAASVTSSAAISGGVVSSTGGASVTDRGICWSAISDPTIAVNQGKKSSGIGTGNFTSTITGLEADKKYYVKAYALNSEGIPTYGNQIEFTTLAEEEENTIIKPTLSTNTISNITQTTAGSGGNITSDGSEAVTAKGICWSTSPNPTLATTNLYTDEGSGTSNFNSEMTNLEPGTSYYVVAYATNSDDTGYGQQRIFKTTSQTNELYSDIKIEEIYFDEESNGNQEIHVIIKNVGDANTPAGEDILITYYVNGQQVGTDDVRNLDIGEEKDEYLNNYEFTNDGVNQVEVVISQVSNETVISNNTNSETFNNSSNDDELNIISINPGDSCNTNSTIEVETFYSVELDVSQFSPFAPTAGESYLGGEIRGFWFKVNVPDSWSGFHNIYILDSSSNFDPVLSLKPLCENGFYLYQPNTDLQYGNLLGKGDGEAIQFNANASNNFYVRIYHYYGNETPNISFKIYVE